MATLDEIFAAMPDAAAAETHEYLTIDPNTRQIDVPDAEKIFGVESDTKAERKYFRCPRYVGNGVDLAACFLRVNYRNANGDIDAYLVEDMAHTADAVTFSWELSRKVTQYKGSVQFVVCACYPDAGGSIAPEWHTTLADGTVLEGMEPDAFAAEAETSDVIAQLVAMVNRQTAAVEAEGAAQIGAVQAAAGAATVEAQAAIEKKGAATLASIPEDYTATVAKTNEMANSVKGTMSGEIVRTDDVSPVQHTMAVRARPKNLFDTHAISTTTDTSSAYISEVGESYIVITTRDDYTSGGYKTTGKKLREVCPLLEAGKTYTLSATSDSAVNQIVYIGESWKFGTSKVITEAMLEYHLAFYGFSAAAGEGTGDCRISGIQIEEGDTATEYTPYIDPETVALTRCGKNLFNIGNFVGQSQTQNGVTAEVLKTGEIWIHGTPTDTTIETSITFTTAAGYGNSLELRPGTYIDNYTANTKGDKLRCFPQATAKTGAWIVNLNGWAVEIKQNCFLDKFVVYLPAGVSDAVNQRWRMQVEFGETVTEYAAYSEYSEHTPTEDGTVVGVTSLSPTMMLLTDTAGVIVECEYNRDTNKIIQQLVAAIRALGGTI